jgi:nucleotide-binding universal stress UspA family protein
MKKILVPVDFTELSDKVIEQAATLCSKSGAAMVLLHVTERLAELPIADETLEAKALKTEEKFGITCVSEVREGSIFKDIQAETEEHDYFLVVIGTHGIHGLKQKLLGSDILKVISKIPVPVLVVQSNSPLNGKFEKIVLPVATHQAYNNIIDGVRIIAKLFDSEVIIYSIERPGFEWPETLKKNVDKTKAAFDSDKINYSRVNEKQSILSVGFALQTLKFAQNTGADAIAMMSVPSDEYHYFAQQDKENLLTNEAGIPVLCASNLVKI